MQTKNILVLKFLIKGVSKFVSVQGPLNVVCLERGGICVYYKYLSLISTYLQVHPPPPPPNPTPQAPTPKHTAKLLLYTYKNLQTQDGWQHFGKPPLKNLQVNLRLRFLDWYSLFMLYICVKSQKPNWSFSSTRYWIICYAVFDEAETMNPEVWILWDVTLHLDQLSPLTLLNLLPQLRQRVLLLHPSHS